MKKAIFLDRDGVLVVDEDGFVHKIEDFKLFDSVVEGLKLLKDRFRFFVITNQSGVGKGIFSIEDLHNFNNYLIQELQKDNIKIEKVYYCPHTPEDDCHCRKPSIKFLLDAEKKFGINLKNSYVIGDKPIDIEMGRKAGCKTIFVLTGNSKDFSNVDCDYVAKDILDAAKWIIKNEGNSLLQSDNFFPINKIKSINEIENITSKFKNQKIVTTNGVFDILHVGHIRYLQKAKSLGNVLIVGINSDSSTKKIKGPKRPLNNQNDRAEALAALSCVDYVVVFDEENPIKLLSSIKPNIHVKGGDYKISEIIERGIVEKNNGKVILMGLENGYSTTNLIERIKKDF